MKKSVNRTYLGSIVLGLNDALVELTGVLAGLTLALANSQIILISGFITGFAASLSMAGSEYLSTKAECNHTRKEKRGGVCRSPGRAAAYTGGAYFLTVLFLLFPYLVLSNVIHALMWTLVNAVIVIAAFTYYATIERGESYFHRFFEMLAISMGVAAISFGMGYLIRIWVGVGV
jgi:VIT1/CCC1 family predicted Fe2+/Mn2+ transporter